MPAVGSGRSAQRLGLLGPRREPEELLLDDVGDLADAALEDVGLLEQRRLDPAVAVARGEVGGEPLEAGPGRRLRRQQVARAARGSEGWASGRSLARRSRRRTESAEVALDGDDVLERLDAAHDPGQLRDRVDLERGGHDRRVVRASRRRGRPGC